MDPTSIAQGGTTASAAAGSEGSATTEVPVQPTGGTAADPPVTVTHRTPDSSVVFGWTESIPNAGVCRGAKFTGRFDCMVATLVGRPDKLNGVLSVVLMGSSETQTLELSGGLITVYDENMIRVLLAPMNGALECPTQRLRATIEPTPSDPMPVERQISWVVLGTQPISTGSLVGSLDPNLQTITGDIVIEFDMARCQGDFLLTASP